MSPPTGEVATGEDDLRIVDDYLNKWDRFANGKNELAPFLRENQKGFESALTRLLKAKDTRAPARMVFYPVVKVGGSIAVDSDLGMASAAILRGDLPVTTTKEGERVYFAGDLFFGGKTTARRMRRIRCSRNGANVILLRPSSFRCTRAPANASNSRPSSVARFG